MTVILQNEIVPPLPSDAADAADGPTRFWRPTP